jgi:hypothetical protein
MRTHHGSTECRNWSFDRDADTLAHYRRYARLHSRLYPYLRGLLDEALVHGWPLMRHPALVEPASPGLWAATQEEFYRRRASPLGGVMAAIIRGELGALVAGAELGAWREALALLCTYARAEDFCGLCEALGDRLAAWAESTV